MHQLSDIVSLTDIFPPETLPVRSGLYLTRTVYEDGSTDPFWQFSHFDATDRIWGCGHLSTYAAAEAPDYEFASQSKQWRGVKAPTCV